MRRILPWCSCVGERRALGAGGLHRTTAASRTLRSRLIAGVVVAVLCGSLLSACKNPSIIVSFSKTPARGTTTVTVSVTDPTVTQTTVRVDGAGATPIATSTSPSFSFDLDTTVLSEGAHRLYVASETESGTRAGDYPFKVQNSPPVLASGFQQSKASAWAHRARGGALRGRWSRLRRREERVDQGVRQPHCFDADRVRRSSTAGVQRLRPRTAGLGARPGLPEPSLRLRAVHARRADRRHASGLERQLPDASRCRGRRVRRQRAPVPVAGRRKRDDGHRAGVGQRLVPAVLVALDRDRHVRCRRRALRERR